MSEHGHADDKRSVRIEISPRAIVYVLLAIAAVWLAFKLATVIIVVTIALVMVGTIDPLVQFLEKRGLRRGRALTVVFFLLAIALATLLLLAVPPLVSQILTVLADLPKVQADFVKWLEAHSWAKSLAEQVRTMKLDKVSGSAGTMLLGHGGDVLEAFTLALTTLFLSVYWLADPVRSQALVYAVVPRHYHVKLARVMLELKVIVGGYMRGQLITSAACGLVVFTLMTIMGGENAIAFAIFAAVADVIPLIGGAIGTIPAALSLAHEPLKMGSVLAVMFIYQEVESRVIVPRVYGRVLRLSPAIVLVALLTGAALLGMLGALLALPIAAGVQMIIRELRVDLPGEVPSSEKMLTRDHKADLIYEALSEGATAADAAVIASSLAATMKESERTGVKLSAEMPALVASLADQLPADPKAVGDTFERQSHDTDGSRPHAPTPGSDHSNES